jgi:hypothetical protein
MRICDLFDKYRDGELGFEEKSEFQYHLAICESCQTKMSLLNNLVHILRQEESQPVDLANEIARRAFLKNESWAALVVSWLSPGPAWAALSLILVLFSFLWLFPGRKQLDFYSEYERLMNETDAAALGASTSISQIHNNSELILWLEQEGNSQ